MRHLKEYNNFLFEGKYPPLRKLAPGEPYSYQMPAFHATVLDYWPSIQRYGLIPGKNEAPGQTFDSKWKGKAIYYHLAFPAHELLNSYDSETGDVWNLVLEVEIHHYAAQIVPDEDVSMDVNYTPTAIKNKEAIALGYIMPPSQFRKIHMIDTSQAREWAKENVKKIPVVFHKPKELEND